MRMQTAGGLNLTFAIRGEGTIDWNNKTVMRLSLRDMGHFLHVLEANDESVMELKRHEARFSDTGVFQAYDFDNIARTLTFGPRRGGNEHTHVLRFVDYDERDGYESVKSDMSFEFTVGDARVMRSILEFSIPRVIGLDKHFDRLVQQSNDTYRGGNADNWDF